MSVKNKKCLGCDNLIELPTKKNYCSANCYSKNYQKEWYQNNKIVTIKVEKTCESCGKNFLPKTKRSNYCSSKCNHKDFARKKSGFYDIKSRSCEYCGESFIPKKGKNTKCCSGKCNSSLWAKNNPEKTKENKKNGEKRRRESNPEDFYNKKRLNSRKNQKWSNIKRVYGLSKEQYFSLIELQNNRCKICNNLFKGGADTHIDHCHESGKVRGLLCFSCNVGLGNFKDNIQLFYNAIHYLEQNK